ncbi:MAG: PEP-CTERM sorting domain-containing protein [Pseudomonadota bacterium]|nr:PEP-CTERM sorting domain-containing protein [Pseudomonadota bacterium]
MSHYLKWQHEGEGEPGIIAILHCREWRTQWAAALLLSFVASPTLGASILFIGNSFTFAYGSPVRYYRAGTVTDVNSGGHGGVPALFKSFTDQTGLSYDVFLETEPGVGIDWHLNHKLPLIGRHAWDTVVMHGFSTLDAAKPGDPSLLVSSVRQMAGFLRTKNDKVDIHLMATWPRADQVYLDKGAWYGKSIEAMGQDVRDGYNRAAAAAGNIKVVPVGDAWVRAMHTGVADSNPYDGIDAGKINLWTYDSYHASTYGYYLEALILFGQITGHDPRVLGEHECSGFELGLSGAQVVALQQVAFDQLAAESTVRAPAASAATKLPPPGRCAAAHPRRPPMRVPENKF